MRQIAVFLVFLLLILTFNAYACVLPLQTVREKDCSSEPEEQARQTCDAFLVIGPQSQPFANHPVSLFTFEDAAPVSATCYLQSCSYADATASQRRLTYSSLDPNYRSEDLIRSFGFLCAN